MTKPRVIILLGAPGAGKGTQAELLAEHFNFYCLETSKIIEQNVMQAKAGEYVTLGGKKYSLIRERKLWKSGILCSPPIVSYWVKEKIKELRRENKGIVITGSPRTLFEAQDQTPLLKKLFGIKNIVAVMVEISPETTIWRNSHRRICELMRHPILYTKETARLKYCPLDGSRLVRRKGLDDPKIIKVRLKEYKERTFPVIEYMQNQGIKTRIVNGEQSVERVFKDILKAIQK